MNDQQLFALYFAGIVGWTLHPGYLREGHGPKTIEQCRELAQKMVQITNEEYGKREDSLA